MCHRTFVLDEVVLYVSLRRDAKKGFPIDDTGPELRVGVLLLGVDGR